VAYSRWTITRRVCGLAPHGDGGCHHLRSHREISADKKKRTGVEEVKEWGEEVMVVDFGVSAIAIGANRVQVVAAKSPDLTTHTISQMARCYA